MPTRNDGTLVVRLPEERCQQLRSLARRLSAERDEDVTLSALAREALEAKFWPPGKSVEPPQAAQSGSF